MEKKDIVVVRIPEIFDLNLEEREIIVKKYNNVLSNQFIVIILWNENNTDKTQFEIIKC